MGSITFPSKNTNDSDKATFWTDIFVSSLSANSQDIGLNLMKKATVTRSVALDAHVPYWRSFKAAIERLFSPLV